MAGIPFQMTPYEAGRYWANNYAGKVARLSLAVNPGTLSLLSTTAAWDAVELSGNGYARHEWILPAGSYNSVTERFEAPTELCQFQASSSGTGLSWNIAYIVVGTGSIGSASWNSGVSFILTESPSIALYPGEPKGYSVRLFTDGFIVTS